MDLVNVEKTTSSATFCATGVLGLRQILTYISIINDNKSIEYFSIRKHTRKSIAPEDSTSDADNTLNINSSPGLFEISQVSAADFHISS